MLSYFDSSALVKRYLEEVGSREVRASLAAGRVATSRLTQAEILSALARRYRDGAMERHTFDVLGQVVDKDAAEMDVIEMSAEVIERLPELFRRHPLRAADAVHLASALLIREKTREDVTFVTADIIQSRAAAAQKLPTVLIGAARRP